MCVNGKCINIVSVLFYVILLSLASQGCSTGVQEQIAKAPEAKGVVATAPSYAIGDYWKYSETLHTVVDAGNDKVKMSISGRMRCAENCKEVQVTMNRNLTWEKIQCYDGRALPACNGWIGLKFLDFPLWVGKRWYFVATYPNVSTGQLNTYRNEMQVSSYEDVTIPAGTFKAFKIRQRVMNMDYRYAEWNLWAYRWYAPEVGNFVQKELYNGSVEDQLQSYKRQK